jgi:hypothetical protein
MIVILTVAEDLHALVVQKLVRAAGFWQCHIVECDRIAQRNFLSYGINFPVDDEILTSEDRRIALADATVMWLRRIRSEQSLRVEVADEGARGVINSDCSGALTGFLSTHFHGKWISTPEATSRAADKVGQLQAAHECGFRVPRTLVSQSRDAVLDFHESCGGNIVVKTVVGAPGPFLQTVRLADPRSLDESSFAAAPAIFQECIEGCEHLRLNCFGNESYAALIRSEDLDWRVNLDVPISSYAVPQELHRKVRGVLDRLGLEMGVVDLKLTPEHEPVWLEVNPQGQFIFLDAFTDLKLAESFAAYLLAVRAGRG